MSSDSDEDKRLNEEVEKHTLIFQNLIDENHESERPYDLPDADRLARKYAYAAIKGLLPPHGSPEHLIRACTVESKSLKEAITKGPVLSLDIDGVLAPEGRGSFKTFDNHNPPPGFYLYSPGVMDDFVSWHPRLAGWLRELNDTYAQVTWHSSWGHRSGQMAACIGVDFGESWCRLHGSGKVGKGYEGVAEDVPLAMVDDHFYFSRNPETRELIASRSAPTLILVPNPAIGLGRAAVDLLLEFANDPWQEKFKVAEPMLIYADPEMRWAGATDDPEGWTGSEDQLRPDYDILMYQLKKRVGEEFLEGKFVVSDDELVKLLEEVGIKVKFGKSFAFASPEQPEVKRLKKMVKYQRSTKSGR